MKRAAAVIAGWAAMAGVTSLVICFCWPTPTTMPVARGCVTPERQNEAAEPTKLELHFAADAQGGHAVGYATFGRTAMAL